MKHLFLRTEKTKKHISKHLVPKSSTNTYQTTKGFEIRNNRNQKWKKSVAEPGILESLGKF
jgi:hypothetical protein